jgi:hypothetical protein
MRRTALVLVLSVWGALPAAGRAGAEAPTAVPPAHGPVVVGQPVPGPESGPGHGAPAAGCATCGHGEAAGPHEVCGDREEVARPCLFLLARFFTYFPGPYCGKCNGCGEPGACDGCGTCGHCLLGCCGHQCAPCCDPLPYTFFLHHCACYAHVHHYPVVYKTWECKWPPAFAGPRDEAVYTDDDRFTP